jgi:hypothetical protein
MSVVTSQSQPLSKNLSQHPCVVTHIVQMRKLRHRTVNSYWARIDLCSNLNLSGFRAQPLCYLAPQWYRHFPSYRESGGKLLVVSHVIGHGPGGWTHAHTHTHTHWTLSQNTFLMGNSPRLLSSFLDLFILKNMFMTLAKYRKSWLVD